MSDCGGDEDGNLREPLPLDVDGRLRIMKCRVDIGAFEFIAGAPASGDINSDGITDLSDLSGFAAAVFDGGFNCIRGHKWRRVVERAWTSLILQNF